MIDSKVNKRNDISKHCFIIFLLLIFCSTSFATILVQKRYDEVVTRKDFVDLLTENVPYVNRDISEKKDR